MYSPCIRGCFSSVASFNFPKIVFPVHTGVFLVRCIRRYRKSRIPRAYGGVSRVIDGNICHGWYSPCIRGCFSLYEIKKEILGVFPVHTGVFLCDFFISCLPRCIPRAYGGVSCSRSYLQELIPYSPCIRGCFYIHHLYICRYLVFPVHTGVFHI